jgi:hypothetical protein
MAYSSIVKPTDYFRTKLYTGNGSNDRAITFDESTNMQPDWLWIKSRGTGQSHAIFDAVRGANKRLVTNSSGAETTENTNLDSFDTNGFTIDNEAIVNENGIGYASWNWKANGAGSTNYDGSITSTVSANQTAGFSIVSWTANAVTGSTIGHGLGVKPNMIILKNRSPDTASWPVYHSSLGATKFLSLNLTNASSTSSTRWDNEEPSSTVFKTGSSGDVKGDNSGEPFIAYCFAEKKGYSKFGSYEGNGNANGTFVYTGFRPAWVMIKNTEGTDNWNIYDNKRLGYNTNYSFLIANETNAENTTTSTANLDIISNGFKVRASTGHLNTSGDKYIYMAFGQSLVGSNNIPCTAR